MDRACVDGRRSCDDNSITDISPLTELGKLEAPVLRGRVTSPRVRTRSRAATQLCPKVLRNGDVT
jgi:hypothetical protein